MSSAWPQVSVLEGLSGADELPGGSQAFVGCVLGRVFELEERTLRLSVRLTDDAEIRALHERYAGVDEATDVVSFELGASGDVPESEQAEGEVVVSLEHARACASAHEHDAAAETALYLVHGTLHLLGYDDRDADASAAMRVAEKRALDSLGLFVRGRYEAGA